MLRWISRFRFALALCVALGLWLLIQPLTARAETITVTNTLDDGAGSLRQTIAVAVSGDTVVFSDTLAGQTITLTNQLEINKNLTIDGGSLATPITLSGNNAVRVFAIGAGNVVALSHLSIVSGTVADNGGGIYNTGTLRVTHCTLSGNAATAGGGIYNAGGTATVAESTLAGNTAIRYGGGLYTNGGTVTVIDSTFANNRTTYTPWANGYGGGGLYNNGSTLNVQNSTFADNAAPQNCGGGLYNAGAATVQASTLSGNSAGYGGGIWNESGNLELRQTIVANSSAGYDCSKGMYSGNVTSLDGLFEATQVNACGVSGDYNTVFGVDPLLGPLDDNGGKTPTFALLPNSPAIDAVKLGSCLAADQRGEPRADLACDIGAYERQLSDGDTVVKSGLKPGVPYSFGPTRLRITVTGGDAGTITATKHLTTPGGLYDTGEITATWYLTASHSPFTVTLSLCYTAEELGDLDAGSLQAFRWDGLDWTLPISTGLTVAEGCVTLSGIEQFSAWTLKDVSVGEATPTAITLREIGARGGLWGGAALAAVLACGVVHVRRRKARH